MVSVGLPCDAIHWVKISSGTNTPDAIHWVIVAAVPIDSYTHNMYTYSMHEVDLRCVACKKRVGKCAANVGYDACANGGAWGRKGPSNSQ